MTTQRILVALTCALALQSAIADSYFLNEGDHHRSRTEDPKEFSEVSVALPAVPNPNEGDWYEFYVSPIFKGKPRILLSSIQTAEDGSIRYILNNRSGAGYDNITAEGIFCITGTKLLDSEGSKLKTFGYADTVNNRWIEPRKSEWMVLGGSRTSNDQVRRVLYNGFCRDGRANNDDELRKRVQEYGSSRPSYH
ncbi:CNP1-like family protein [Neisseriaceae bacterium B1]